VVIPESTKTSLRQKLEARRRERWPGLSRLEVRYCVVRLKTDTQYG
jgi:hypothetical protein